MIVKHESDHVLKDTICGRIREIVGKRDGAKVNIAVLEQVGETKGHFHETFDEVYFVLHGWLTLRLHDPATGRTWNEQLGHGGRYELCVIEKGLHHKVVDASRDCTLCVVSVPPFVPGDEQISEVLETNGGLS